jgi:hypothetical protein
MTPSKAIKSRVTDTKDSEVEESTDKELKRTIIRMTNKILVFMHTRMDSKKIQINS